ncbi:MAG: 2-phosphosulfolactate phosphatase [Bacteroidales bacterium]|nr:2-phosphosulfolactate phosphatase [Bacteroidales bacterium]
MYSEQGDHSIQVCFSPLLWPLFRQDDTLVIITDIFRASTAICAAFHNEVSAVIPVETISESEAYKKKGFICAGERDGKTLDCADFGNSPFNFLDPGLKGETIVMNTTNGTRAIKRATEGNNVVIVGAFSNLDAVINYALRQHKNIIIFCAGWKDRFCTEDSLFAGAVVTELIERGQGAFHTMCDAAIASAELWNIARHDLLSFIEKTAHRHRLRKLGLDDVIPYCLELNTTSCLPIVKNDRLVSL